MDHSELTIQMTAYIHENLDQDLKVPQLANIAAYSEGYFYKVFQKVTGSTTASYVRNSRLAQAADDLLRTDMKIIDIALKHGYSAPESFTKAFKRKYGVSPTEYRIQAIKGAAYSISFDDFDLDVQKLATRL